MAFILDFKLRLDDVAFVEHAYDTTAGRIDGIERNIRRNGGDMHDGLQGRFHNGNGLFYGCRSVHGGLAFDRSWKGTPRCPDRWSLTAHDRLLQVRLTVVLIVLLYAPHDGRRRLQENPYHQRTRSSDHKADVIHALCIVRHPA